MAEAKKKKSGKLEAAEIPLPANTPATPAASWKKRADVSSGAHPLEVPSGNTALVRRPGMETILKLGLVPNSLMSIVQAAMDGQDPSEEALATKAAELLDDPARLSDLLGMVDRITMLVVIEPHLESAPPPNVERNPDTLYVDEVDLNDKMFIFQYVVGGTSELESFRELSAAQLGALRDGEGVEQSTE